MATFSSDTRSCSGPTSWSRGIGLHAALFWVISLHSPPIGRRAKVRTRTMKEAGCRRFSRWKRCCVGDGGAGPWVVWWPSAVAVQAEAANRPELLRSRAVVVSVVGEVAP